MPDAIERAVNRRLVRCSSIEELARLAMTAMIRRLSGSAIATTRAIRRCPTRQRSSLSQARLSPARPARSLGVVLRFSCISWLANAVSPDRKSRRPAEMFYQQDGIAQWPIQGQPPDQSGELDFNDRSEERRVGKECRSR